MGLRNKTGKLQRLCVILLCIPINLSKKFDAEPEHIFIRHKLYSLKFSSLSLSRIGHMNKYICIIAPLSDVPMFYANYLTMHKMHMHSGAIRQLL